MTKTIELLRREKHSADLSVPTSYHLRPKCCAGQCWQIGELLMRCVYITLSLSPLLQVYNEIQNSAKTQLVESEYH